MVAIPALEIIQYDFLRCVFNLGKCASKFFLLHESGIYTMHDRRRMLALCFWAKLTTLKENSPAFVAYDSIRARDGHT